MRLVAMALGADLVATTLEDCRTGYLLRDEPLGGLHAGESFVRGFVYSADLACQRFFELTGVDLSEEEVVPGEGAR